MSIFNNRLVRSFMAVYGVTTPCGFIATFLAGLLFMQVLGVICHEDTLSLSYLVRSIFAILFWPYIFTLLWRAGCKILSRFSPSDSSGRSH